jgi:cell fate regulator YaaT (PSP1 superfamily)
VSEDKGIVTEENPPAAMPEAAEPTVRVAAVRFQEAGKAYHYRIPDDLALTPRAWVVVPTARGEQVARVVAVDVPLEGRDPSVLKTILRRATGLDMLRYQTLKRQGEELVKQIRGILRQMKLREVKIATAEFTLAGDFVTVLYTGNLPGKSRSTLKRRIASLARCSVELKAIGPRDYAKYLGGYGVCGQPLCCATHLTEFRNVSIRMAKDQSISMAPSDTTGMCGRLRCCLAFEHPVYLEESKDFPKRKARVQTPEGLGRVIDWDVLKRQVVVEIPPTGPRIERKRHRFGVDEVTVVPKEETP